MLNIGKESFCGHPLTTTDAESIWVAPRQDGKGIYVALFNLSDEEKIVSLPENALEGAFSTGMELWTKQPIVPADGLSAKLAPHDTAVYLLK